VSVAEYGVATPLMGDMPRGRALQVIVEAGFRHVELWTAPGHLDDWITGPAGLRRDLDRLGLTPFSVHSPSNGWHTADSDPEVRRAAVEATCKSLEWAAEVGAGVVVVHPSSSREEENPAGPKLARARSRESLSIFAERAGELGLMIAVENLPIRKHKFRPGTTVADVLGLIDGLGDHVGVCLDAGHSNLNGLDPAEEAALAGDKLFTMHLQDNDRSGDQHLAPGRGTVNWDAVLGVLNQMGYTGGRMFEVGAGEAGVEQTLNALAQIRDRWLSPQA